MSTLFNLTVDASAILTALEGTSADDTTGTPEDKAALSDALDKSLDDIRAKTDAVAAVLAELKSRSDAQRAEASRLTEMARVSEAQRERLCEYVMTCMGNLSATELRGAVHRLKVCAAGGRRKIAYDNPRAIPDSYKRQVTEVDTEKVRKALESGVEIPGCRLEPKGKYLASR